MCFLFRTAYRTSRPLPILYLQYIQLTTAAVLVLCNVSNMMGYIVADGEGFERNRLDGDRASGLAVGREEEPPPQAGRCISYIIHCEDACSLLWLVLAVLLLSYTATRIIRIYSLALSRRCSLRSCSCSMESTLGRFRAKRYKGSILGLVLFTYPAGGRSSESRTFLVRSSPVTSTIVHYRNKL